jgi:type IV pilus assembly protein PilA
LLVVIAIIAILASLAIPYYLNYQKKAKVSSYAEPIARGCMMDLVAYCMDNPSATISPIVGPMSPAPNCRNATVSTAGGNVNLSASTASVTCGGDGTLTFGSSSGGGVIATVGGITEYQARCYAASNSIRCLVEAP